MWRRAAPPSSSSGRSGALVNCWFCDTDQRVPSKDANSFVCVHCEQYNGFSADGNYNQPLSYIQRLLPGAASALVQAAGARARSVYARKKQGNYGPQPSLCKACQCKQELLLQDPERKPYALCARCDQVVSRHVQLVDQRIKSQQLGDKVHSWKQRSYHADSPSDDAPRASATVIVGLKLMALLWLISMIQTGDIPRKNDTFQLWMLILWGWLRIWYWEFEREAGTMLLWVATVLCVIASQQYVSLPPQSRSAMSTLAIVFMCVSLFVLPLAVSVAARIRTRRFQQQQIDRLRREYRSVIIEDDDGQHEEGEEVEGDNGGIDYDDNEEEEEEEELLGPFRTRSSLELVNEQLQDSQQEDDQDYHFNNTRKDDSSVYVDPFVQRYSNSRTSGRVHKPVRNEPKDEHEDEHNDESSVGQLSSLLDDKIGSITIDKGATSKHSEFFMSMANPSKVSTQAEDDAASRKRQRTMCCGSLCSCLSVLCGWLGMGFSFAMDFVRFLSPHASVWSTMAAYVVYLFTTHGLFTFLYVCVLLVEITRMLRVIVSIVFEVSSTSGIRGRRARTRTRKMRRRRRSRKQRERRREEDDDDESDESDEEMESACEKFLNAVTQVMFRLCTERGFIRTCVRLLCYMYLLWCVIYQVMEWNTDLTWSTFREEFLGFFKQTLSPHATEITIVLGLVAAILV